VVDQERTPVHALNLSFEKAHPTLCTATVSIPAALVDTLYNQAIMAHTSSVSAYGFSRGSVPIGYVEQNFKITLLEHLKEFLFKYFVLGYLLQEIRVQKMCVAGDPRLVDIQVMPTHDAYFKFDLSLFDPISFNEWKYFPFKAPKRKNYKDLDRQVELFLQEEAIMAQSSTDAIDVGDWVNFSLSLTNLEGHQLVGNYKADLWIKIGDEEADKPFHDVFMGKKMGDRFCSQHRCFQDYFSNHLDTPYVFCVEINDVVPYQFFCLDQFKNHFKLKTNKELYQKLIEVFSYRNDLSQRRTTVEESLKLLLAKHPFEVPNHLILRQQKSVLAAIQDNPDYHVYRVQKDFKDRVRELAEKQIKEQLIIDQLAFHEDIPLTPFDVKTYLNLTKRPRTKEFIYFDPPVTKMRGQEAPISNQELQRTCLREKTLNHIIYYLTKK